MYVDEVPALTCRNLRPEISPNRDRSLQSTKYDNEIFVLSLASICMCSVVAVVLMRDYVLRP